MFLYVIIYALMLIANAVLWIAQKGRLWILAVELTSNLFMLLMICLYYYPQLLDRTGSWLVAGVPLMLAVEYYFSVHSNLNEIVPEQLKTDDGVLESARVFSILFSAPGYIVSGLLFLQVFFKL